MENPVQTITQARDRIEREFKEPLRDVVADYAEAMGYSCPLVAEVLDVSPESLKSYCRRADIHFPRKALERRSVSPGRPPRLHRENGREKSLTAWAIDLNLSVEGVRKRIRHRGRVR